MSLKDDIKTIKIYVTEHVAESKTFIALELKKLSDALAALAGSGINNDDTAAIGASIANIKAQMDGLAAVEVEQEGVGAGSPPAAVPDAPAA